ncbi:uncharacterized protein LOC112086634 [Eutrema salsugineum]|uniref:uncharacterized protein LOC112086634 n=1 Tax=Eutrema salsugineum TaxID=72664 RepID=UPI000CED5235|nr:uncharacterized protein LOC112086634 [Eutrema salsugineum]
MLDRAASQRKLGYHPRCSNIGLTHLCFADDLMIFSDGKLRSLVGIVNVFDEFTKTSRLRISLEKSTAYLAGVTASARDNIAQRFAFNFDTLLVRYLGLPLLTKKMRTLDYAPLIDKIKENFNSWITCALSYAGRLQLLTSVIESLVNFWMAAFTQPNWCIDEIESLCSAFLSVRTRS